jgi:hypothetical protein
MSAIENCRTAALGGHIECCENGACGHMAIAYNSCMNRHCPKCQGAAAREWLAAREAELLPVQYFHQVFTLPAAIADIACQNKAVIYDLLFKASAETMLTIGADPKHLGARTGFIAVLHTRALRRSGARFAARSARLLKTGSAFPTRPLGFGDDASSARAHDRAGRRAIAGWHALDSLPAPLLPASAGALQAVPPAHA